MGKIFTGLLLISLSGSLCAQVGSAKKPLPEDAALSAIAPYIQRCLANRKPADNEERQRIRQGAASVHNKYEWFLSKKGNEDLALPIQELMERGECTKLSEASLLKLSQPAQPAADPADSINRLKLHLGGQSAVPAVKASSSTQPYRRTSPKRRAPPPKADVVPPIKKRKTLPPPAP